MKTIPLAVVLASALLGTGILPAASDPRPDLTGRVTETDGSPVAGAAVFIYSAGPRHGISHYCPTCYADCVKKAKTDSNGRFKIESLDPSLVFQLLVISQRHETKFVHKVDPTEGGQAIDLTRLTEEELKSGLRISGSVVGEDGKPVPEAIIRPEEVLVGQGPGWENIKRYVEPIAVADENGRFMLFCKDNAAGRTINATVEGPGAAKQWVSLKPGGDNRIQTKEGVTVTGRILQDGKPLSGVELGIATTTYASWDITGAPSVLGKLLKGYEAVTDADGHFHFFNVPPSRQFVFYAELKSVPGPGAVPKFIFISYPSKGVQDLGDLAAKPAFKVAGRIVLSNGEPIPAGTRIMLNQAESWAQCVEVELPADGAFEFKGVPAEPVCLVVVIDGCKFSKSNPSWNSLDGQILGRVTGDVTNLVLLMEPGHFRYSREGMRPTDPDPYPVDKPLRGVNR